MVSGMQRYEFVEFGRTAVERKAHLAYLALLPLLQHEIHHPVVHIALLEGCDSALAYGMHQVVVEVVGLHLVEGVVIHLLRGSRGSVPEVGKFRGYVEALARITAQGYAGSPFRLTLEICRRGVIIVHPVLHGIVDEFVDLLLVNDIPAGIILDHRPSHTAVTQKGDLVAIAGIGPHLHGPLLLWLP